MQPGGKRENPGNVYEFTPEGRRRSAAGKTKMRWPSKTSIILAVLCLLLFIICIALMVLLIDANDENKKGKNSIHSVCLTEECVASAARISNNIDHRVQPCEDFYKFACGSWVENNVVPEDETTFTFLGQHQTQIDRTIQNALEADKDILDLRSFREAKTFYKSCMNETQIDVINKTDLEVSLRTMGKLPLITPDWSENNFNSIRLLIKMAELLTPPFFDLTVGVDPNNINKKVLQLNLMREWYLPKHSDRNVELTMIKKAAESLGGQDKPNDFNRISDLHHKLLDIAQNYSQEQERDENKKPFALSTLDSKFPGVVDWELFVRGVLQSTGITISDSENILVESPTHIRQVLNVLLTIDARTMANFILLNFALSFSNKLGDKYQRVLSDQESRGEAGVSHRGARNTFCLWETIQARGYAIASVFIKQKFDNGSRNPILDVTKELRSAFNESLKDIDWLTERAKIAIREKNDNMSVIVGFPDEFARGTFPDTYYRSQHFEEKAFFNNSLIVRAEQFNRLFKSLRSDRSRYESLELPYTVSVQYEPNVNQLYASAAVLQPPVFAKDYAKYLIYGNLGAWLATRIIGGMNQSVATNAQSNRFGDAFLNEVDTHKLKKKLQCFEDQMEYSEDPETGAKYNRSYKDIAHRYAAGSDGVRLGYKAYKTWQARQSKDELTLPSLNYTQDQLFFLTFAQLVCEKTAKPSVQNYVSMHFMLNAIYKNTPEFVETFKCPANSKMNSRNKCAVWGK